MADLVKAPLVLIFIRFHRWATVHIGDMKTIPHASEISLKNLLSQFSVMPLDQVHEQNNVKENETGKDRGLSLIEGVDGVRPRTSEARAYWPSLKLSIMQNIGLKQIPHATKKDLQESIHSRVK